MPLRPFCLEPGCAAWRDVPMDDFVDVDLGDGRTFSFYHFVNPGDANNPLITRREAESFLASRRMSAPPAEYGNFVPISFEVTIQMYNKIERHRMTEIIPAALDWRRHRDVLSHLDPLMDLLHDAFKQLSESHLRRKYNDKLTCVVCGREVDQHGDSGMMLSP